MGELGWLKTYGALLMFELMLCCPSFFPVFDRTLSLLVTDYLNGSRAWETEYLPVNLGEFFLVGFALVLLFILIIGTFDIGI